MAEAIPRSVKSRSSRTNTHSNSLAPSWKANPVSSNEGPCRSRQHTPGSESREPTRESTRATPAGRERRIEGDRTMPSSLHMEPCLVMRWKSS
eukprot:3121711-Rhodomonas_salina.1